MMPLGLDRHWLAYPDRRGREAIRRQLRAHPAARWVERWLHNGWPLCVTRQPPCGTGELALGLPLPPSAGKLRIGVRLPGGAVERLAAPRGLAEVAQAVGEGWSEPLARLHANGSRVGLDLRVFGSLAWFSITGWAYVTRDSDVDLTCAVHSTAMIASCNAIAADWEGRYGRRLDVELLFPSGRAVPMREWAAATVVHGTVRDVVAKSLRAVERIPIEDLREELHAAVA